MNKESGPGSSASEEVEKGSSADLKSRFEAARARQIELRDPKTPEDKQAYIDAQNESSALEREYEISLEIHKPLAELKAEMDKAEKRLEEESFNPNTEQPSIANFYAQREYNKRKRIFDAAVRKQAEEELKMSPEKYEI